MNTLLKIFLTEAFLFISTILLGIAVALRIEELLVHASGGVDAAITIGAFLFYFLIATLLLLFFSRKGKSFFFRFILIFSVIIGGWLTLLPFLKEYSLPILLLLVFFLIRKPFLFIHNICIIIAVAGVGAVIGISIDPFVVILFATVLSLYDVIAVYKTKHMVKMAEGMVESRAIMGIIIPLQLRDFFVDIKKTDLRNRFMILGGGDIVIPLLMCVSLLSYGVGYSLMMLLFSFLGLAFSFMFFISPEVKRPIPALPPIVFMLIFGYIILEVFNHVGFFYMVS